MGDNDHLDAAEQKRSFIQRHRPLFRRLTIVVAIAGFLVNERFRDHLKELGDSINSAQSTFEIREEVSSLGRLLSQKDEPALASNEQAREHRSNDEEARVRLAWIRSDVSTIGSQVDQTRELQEKIGVIDDTQYHAIEKRLTDIWRIRSEIENDLESGVHIVNIPGKTHTFTPLERAGLAILDCFDAEEDTREYSNSTVAAARRHKEEYEQKYTVVQWLGFGLVVIGLGLSHVLEQRVETGP